MYRELLPSRSAHAPLPRNVASPRDLPRRREPWGLSLRDVPERRVEPRAIARLPACSILPFEDPWGTRFHELRTRTGRALRLRGMGAPEGSTSVGPAGPELPLGETAWIVERWHRNYYHWLVHHLPKLLVLQEQGVERLVAIPGEGRLRAVIEDSIRALGIEADRLRILPEGPAVADPMWVVETDRCDPELLRELRARIAGPRSGASLAVHVSRRAARRRRLANEDEIRSELERRGVLSVDAEALTFAEQVSLAGRTEVLIGAHGAGLASMLFMPEGSHVIELAHPGYPSPAFYALAAALGLHYWLLWGEPCAARGPETLDIRVDRAAVARAVDSAMSGR